MPDLHSGEKEEIYNWSRETFPELKLNVRWSKQRLLHTVKSYMRTPQVYLGFDVLQDLSQVLNATSAAQERFARCMGDECAMNLNVRLDELSSWANLPTIPAGFGWTGRNARRESADRFVNVREDTEYTGFRVGLGQPEWELNSFTEGGYGSDAGAPAWDYESGPKNWKRDQEGYNDKRFLDDLYLSAVGRDDILRGNLGDPRRRSPRAAGYGGLGAAPFRTSRDEYSYERIHWDMLPEVYDAIKLNRGNHWGRPAKFTDMAHCLASLNELLIRGDFFSTENSRKSAWGPGETVRLDYVALAQRDPHEGEPIGVATPGIRRLHAVLGSLHRRKKHPLPRRVLQGVPGSHPPVHLQRQRGARQQHDARRVLRGLRRRGVRGGVPGMRPRVVRARRRGSR